LETRKRGLFLVDRHGDHLAAIVLATGGTDAVGKGGFAAGGADTDFGKRAVMRGAAEALLHFGGFVFGLSHDVLEKRVRGLGQT